MPAQTRQEQKAATRQALLAAARQLLSERPTAQVGAIAEAAGVATGTFYVHFKNKEALLDELMAEFNAEFLGRVGSAWQAGTLSDPEALIRSLATACLGLWAENKGLLECFFRRAARGEDLSILRDGINPPVAEFLSQGLATFAAGAGVELSSPPLITQGLLGMWTRIGLQYLFNDEVSLEEATDTLTRLSLGALRGVLPGLLEETS